MSAENLSPAERYKTLIWLHSMRRPLPPLSAAFVLCAGLFLLGIRQPFIGVPLSAMLAAGAFVLVRALLELLDLVLEILVPN